MDEPTPRRRLLACMLAALGGLVSLLYVLATPGRLVGYMEKDGQLVEIGSNYNRGTIVLVSIQAIAAIVMAVGLVAAVTKRNKLASQSFGVATIVGLIPAILPGVLAFFARRLIARKPANP